MAIRTTTVSELAGLRQAGIDLIDVRTPGEFGEVHAEEARSTPLGSLDPAAIMRARGDRAGRPLYVICRSGSRSREAAEAFRKAGFDDVFSVEGGTTAWEKAGLPVVRGARSISMERQVRIAAGSAVVLGSALGAFVHPGFIGLAAFIGAGLVFAGITDTCGMGLVLARMPWNRSPSSP